MRMKIGLGLLASVWLAAPVMAAEPAATPVPPTPAVAAPVVNPNTRPVLIPVGGVELHAALTPAAMGSGPRPTAVLLHGMPGDLAMAYRPNLVRLLTDQGWNVLTLNFRGSLGDPGDFSFTHELEDVAAGLAWLRDGKIAKPAAVDTRKLVLIGHSMGGWAAGVVAARDPGLAGVALISPYDVAAASSAPGGIEAAHATLGQLVNAGALSGTTAEALIAEVQQNRDTFSLAKAGAKLADKPLLLLTADDGGEVFTDPFQVALRGAGGGRLFQTHHGATDHNWSSQPQQLLDWVGAWLNGLD